MRYMVRKSIVEILGTIWMPMVECGQRQELRSYDVENLRDDDGMGARHVRRALPIVLRLIERGVSGQRPHDSLRPLPT